MGLEKGRKNTEVVEEAVPMKHLARQCKLYIPDETPPPKGGTLYENNRSITYSLGTLFTQHFPPKTIRNGVCPTVLKCGLVKER